MGNRLRKPFISLAYTSQREASAKASESEEGGSSDRAGEDLLHGSRDISSSPDAEQHRGWMGGWVGGAGGCAVGHDVDAVNPGSIYRQKGGGGTSAQLADGQTAKGQMQGHHLAARLANRLTILVYLKKIKKRFK